MFLRILSIPNAETTKYNNERRVEEREIKTIYRARDQREVNYIEIKM